MEIKCDSRAAPGAFAQADKPQTMRLDASSPPAWVGKRKDPAPWILTLVLLLVTLVLGHGILRTGDLALYDEGAHAMTGAYFADLLRDVPFHHLVQYTYEYYARYPSLGLVHWPPLFPFLEGVVFRLTGPSLLAARATALAFALIGLTFWFLLVKELLNPWAAAFATVLLAFLPVLVPLEQAVMLEVPSLALCLMATYFWARFLRTNATRMLCAFLAVAALAVLTKQHAVYLLPFCLLSLLLDGKWRWLASRRAALALAIFALLITPFFLLAIKLHLNSILQHVVPKHLWTASRFDFYIFVLPGLAGWPVLALSAVGIVLSHRWSSKKATLIMAVWFLVFYLTFSALNARAPRYFIYALPPLVYFATWPAAITVRFRRMRPALMAVCFIVSAFYIRAAWAQQYPYVSGYRAAVSGLLQTSGGNEIVLLDGDDMDSGNLSFYLRAEDHQRRFVLFRKGLYATRIAAVFGGVEMVHNRAQLQQMLADYGIRHILINDRMPLLFPIQKDLRDLLNSPQFRLEGEYPITAQGKAHGYRRLLLYTNQQATHPTATYLRLPMLTLPHDINVPLRDLGIVR